MNTLEKIMLVGLEVAEKHGVNQLAEKEKITINEEIIENFINAQIEDLIEFSTFEQFDYQNLFRRAFMYTYGKGGEYALSSRLKVPLDRIGYNFHECMKGKISSVIPQNLMFHLNKNSSLMLEMYDKMFDVTKVGAEKMISEELNFENCLYRILNGGFYYGTRIILSLDVDEKMSVDFSANQNDEKYDYDNYDNDYSEDDFKTIDLKIGDFDDIRHLFDKE